MSHWIHPEAEAELEEAALYLAEHASSALAEALLLEFERVVGLLVKNQQRGPHSDFGMRLYHLDRFHYTVFYEENAVLGPQIYAVAPQAREPGYWLQRASEQPGGLVTLSLGGWVTLLAITAALAVR